MDENQLIQQYKEDFTLKIGKVIEIRILDKWDELCYFDREVPLWKLIRMIHDFTEWNPIRTFAKCNRPEFVSRRQIVDLIAISNGRKLIHIGKETGRDHTTVLHSVKMAKDLVDRDILYRTLVREVMAYIRENYPYYKDKTFTKEDLIPQQKGESA